MFKSFIETSGQYLATNPETLANRIDKQRAKLEAMERELVAVREAHAAIGSPEMVADIRALVADKSDHPDHRHNVCIGFGAFSIRKYAGVILDARTRASGRIVASVNIFKALKKG